MANKALATRQKLMIRTEATRKASKPRNPVAVAAKQRAAGPHEKSTSALRQRQQRALKKALIDKE